MCRSPQTQTLTVVACVILQCILCWTLGHEVSRAYGSLEKLRALYYKSGATTTVILITIFARFDNSYYTFYICSLAVARFN